MSQLLSISTSHSCFMFMILCKKLSSLQESILILMQLYRHFSNTKRKNSTWISWRLQLILVREDFVHKLKFWHKEFIFIICHLNYISISISHKDSDFSLYMYYVLIELLFVYSMLILLKSCNSLLSMVLCNRNIWISCVHKK